MIDVQNLDKGSIYMVKDEKDLLEKDPETVQSFYSLTGQARKDYAIQMAEAEAARIEIIRKAQAEGIMAIRKAEAEGLKLIGEALKTCEDKDLVVKLAGLAALQNVAESLANGKATKLFLPQNLGDIFSLVAGWKEALGVKEPPASTAADG
jgi:ActR/RegA family two-component response regulator